MLLQKSLKNARHGVSFFRWILTQFSPYLRTQGHTAAYRGDKCRSGTIVTIFFDTCSFIVLVVNIVTFLFVAQSYIFIITFLIVEILLICSNAHKCPTTQICLNSISFPSFDIKSHTGRVWRSQRHLFFVLGLKIDKSKIRKFSE